MKKDPQKELARLRLRKESLQTALDRLTREESPDGTRLAWVLKEIAAVDEALRRAEAEASEGR